MKFSNREPPCARKRDSRWTNTNLKRHKAGAQTSGGRSLQVPQGYTYVELHRHAGEAFRGDRARGKRQTEATLPAALSGSESKAPGSAGGYLLGVRRRWLRTKGGLVHPEQVHVGERVGSSGFEAVPGIEIGHGRMLGKARSEALQPSRVQDEAGKVHVVRCKERFDL